MRIKEPWHNPGCQTTIFQAIAVLALGLAALGFWHHPASSSASRPAPAGHVVTASSSPSMCIVGTSAPCGQADIWAGTDAYGNPVAQLGDFGGLVVDNDRICTVGSSTDLASTWPAFCIDAHSPWRYWQDQATGQPVPACVPGSVWLAPAGVYRCGSTGKWGRTGPL